MGQNTPDLDTMFGPKLVLEEEDLQEGPICVADCNNRAKHALKGLRMMLRTSEGAVHIVESTPSGNLITVCDEHKNDDLEEYVIGGCHLSVMNETGVSSELVSYQCFWQEL